MDSLVTVEWLSEHLADPALVVLDCSVHVGPDFHGVNGRAEYDEGHIPGAGFADLMGPLSDPSGPYEFAMPTPEHFCAAMGLLGVGDDSQVVLYAGNMSAWAARVWWMLRWVGFDRAAILDGGLSAWMAKELPLSTDPVERPAKQLTPTLRPALIADREDVRAAVNSGDIQLIDTMMEEHYRGEWALYSRPGHIPGASNVSALSLVGDTGRYLPGAELAAMHPGDRDAQVITYCGGGIAAASNAFVMTRLGFTNVAVYAASLQEWVADPSNPMVIDTP